MKTGKAGYCWSTLLRSSCQKASKLHWLIGPALGLAAFCPLYLFTLLGSWLPHLLALSLLLLLGLLLRRQQLATGWLLAWMLLAASPLALEQEVPAGKQEKSFYPTDALTVAQVNLLQRNSHKQEVLEQLYRLDADVLAFQEVNETWAATLVEALAAEYPYFSLAPQDNNYGMALFSRQPLKEVQLQQWEGYPAISAKLEQQGQDTLILSLHAASPVSLGRFRARQKQLSAAAAFVKAQNCRSLVLGDFNTVPWDPALENFRQTTQLKDSRGTHYRATWPTPFGRWGIPIDYVLHSSDWQTLSSSTFSIPGSDHRGLVATVAMRESSETAPFLRLQ